MLDFYTLQKTLTTLSSDEYTYTPTDIATLCRAGKLTPLFPYDLYVVELVQYDDLSTGYDITTTTPFNGYLTHHKLLPLLDGYDDTATLGNATVFYDNHNIGKDYDVRLLAHSYNYYRYKDDGSYNPVTDFDNITVTSEQLLFSREQVEALAGQTQAPQCHRAQTDTPADNDKELSTRSENLAAKIILALLDIAELDRNSPPYQYDDLSSNNRLIYDQIKANGMKVSPQKIGHWLDLAIKQTTDD